jgi:hypothetical protein
VDFISMTLGPFSVVGRDAAFKKAFLPITGIFQLFLIRIRFFSPSFPYEMGLWKDFAELTNPALAIDIEDIPVCLRVLSFVSKPGTMPSLLDKSTGICTLNSVIPSSRPLAIG